MSLGCIEIVSAATGTLANEASARQVLLMRERNEPPEAFIEFLAERCDPDVAELLREEFLEMPSSTLETIISAWVMAAASGKNFQLRSVPPATPIEYARSRRTRLTLDHEENGVVVSITHVPGRHATWAKQAARVA